MLESFPDPLGKPMQIHEITRKPIQEDVVSGLTNMLYKSAGVANPLDQNLTPGTPVAGNLRQAAAGEMNRSLLMPLAKEMRNRWAQNVQQLLLKSVDKSTGAPVTNASQIDRAALEKEMYLFLNALAGFDIGKIADFEDGSGQAKQLDSELKPQVTAAIANTQKPNPGADVWLPLATSIQRAKSIRTYSQGQKGQSKTQNSGKETLPVYKQAGKTMVDGQPYNPTNPAHIAAVQAVGIDPKTIK
jgi:hypothetical protein